MNALKCPKCGREVMPQRDNYGYIAECCDWIYFRPAMKRDSSVDEIQETDQDLDSL